MEMIYAVLMGWFWKFLLGAGMARKLTGVSAFYGTRMLKY
jgi:hypothetical protein